MATKTKRFRVQLEQHKGTEALIITIPFDVQKTFGTRARVPVCGTINGYAFRSSIFPRGGDGGHYMVVNKQVRAGANVRSGETITVVMERDDEPRIITPPADLARALKANKAAQAAWDKISYSHKKEFALVIEEAKRPETRQRRIEKVIAELAASKKS
jgi:hypothetical protein